MRELEINDIYNCIMGGAIGDALGYPVRDLSYDLIVDDFGKKGINSVRVDSDAQVRVTANTQLLMFTIDALIRAYTRYRFHKEIDISKKITYNNYLRWQVYQGRKCNELVDMDMINNSYLNDVQMLKYERCPEQRMISILENEMFDQIEDEINYNSGFSAIIKSAPYGIVFRKDINLAFDISVQIAKLTHNDPKAYLSAGALTIIIACIANGDTLEKSIENAIKIIEKYDDSQEVLEKINLALEMSKDETHYPEKFDDFGLCDESHEVLGAALYACLVYSNNFSKALLFSVNNGCYSNNIAIVVGQILGLYIGIDDTAKNWIKSIEMKKELEDIIKDFNCIIEGILPKEVEQFDEYTDIEKMKLVDKNEIAKWWVDKYDKI